MISYCEDCGEYLGDYVRGVLFKLGLRVTEPHLCPGMDHHREKVAKIPRAISKLPSDEVEPQKCGNCGTYRTVTDYMVEKCPNCGDNEYSLIE